MNINGQKTKIYDRSLYWLGTDTSLTSGGVKLVLWVQISTLSEIMRSCKDFPHFNQISTLAYNRANSVIIKNAIILNIIHSIFNLHETGDVI